VFWRLGLAVPTMWAVAYLTGGRCSMALLRRALVPGIFFGLSMATSFASYRFTSIVSATLIGSLQPVLVLLVAGRLFGERVARSHLGFAALALAGVAAVVLGGADGSGNGLLGDALAAVSLVLFVTYMLKAKRLRLDGCTPVR
jgi:drug/metabolite transporter (DMT)-like permease